jgi:predicted Zn-dependent peptidase
MTPGAPAAAMSAPAAAMSAPAAAMTSTTTTRTSGIRPWVRADPRWRIAAVSVAVGTGHRADRDGTRGLAHLCEHLVMRHRPEPTAPELFEWLDRIGGIAGAHTWPDHTVFTALVPPDAAAPAVRRFADAIRADAVPGEVLAEEIDKIIEEIRALGPGRGFPWGIAAAALGGGDPVLADGYGDSGQLRGLSAEQVAAFRRAHYVPGNTAVAVVGDIDPERITPIIDEAFAGVYEQPGVSEKDERRRALSPLSGLIAYPMPDLNRNLTAHLAHLVLAKLVTRRLGAAGHPGWLRAGWFGRSLTVRRDDMAVALLPAAAARRAFHDHLRELAAGPVPGAELEQAREQVRLDLRRRLDSPEGYAAEASRSALLLPGTGPPEGLADRVRAVTEAALSRTAAALTSFGGPP